MTWTDERVELLRGLWAEGASASAIAARLGSTTRNAVMGKVHRLGLPGRASERRRLSAPRKPAAPRPSTPRLAAAPKVLALPAPAAAPKPCQPSERPTQDDAAPQEAVTVSSLTEAMCRWPHGDPKTDAFRFCGQLKLETGPYCGRHANIAYR
jgi:GcrA cell cycle regulator